MGRKMESTDKAKRAGKGINGKAIYLKLAEPEYDEARSSHPNLWKEAQFILKYGSESQGYWNRDKFMNPVKHAVTIAEIKYSRANNTIVFLFDQSSGHRQ